MLPYVNRPFSARVIVSFLVLCIRAKPAGRSFLSRSSQPLSPFFATLFPVTRNLLPRYPSPLVPPDTLPQPAPRPLPSRLLVYPPLMFDCPPLFACKIVPLPSHRTPAPCGSPVQSVQFLNPTMMKNNQKPAPRPPSGSPSRPAGTPSPRTNI